MRSLHVFRSRLTSALAVVVLLLGTAAPALARMTCVMSGRSVVTIGKADGCCTDGPDRSAPTVKATCCEVVQTRPHHPAFLSVSGPEVPPVVALLDRPLTAPQAVAAHGTTAPTPFSRPPPLQLIRYLASIGTFLI